MTLAIDVVKRGRKDRCEKFQRQKLFDSIMAVCRSTRTPEGEAAFIADNVCRQVSEWLKIHPEITSKDLRVNAAKVLNNYQPEAAYLYEQYHVII